MKGLLQTIKTIVIGGAVFLVPLVIVAAILGKAFQLMIAVARGVEKWIPIESIAGIALANILAILAIIFLWFLAGMAARSRLGKKLSHGLETALHLLAARQRADESLSRLGGCFERAPQRLINIPVRERPPLEELPEVSDAVRRAKEELADEGRVVVRYSGTEPKARVMVEGPDEAEVQRYASELAALLKKEIG